MEEINNMQLCQLNAPLLTMPENASQVPAAMDNAAVAWTPIAYAPWFADYPYRPQVEVRIAHTGEAILLHYRVWEDEAMAQTPADDGSVWEDSCAECFLSPVPGTATYYNIECNAAGHMLIGYHDGEGNDMRAPQEILNRVQRWASLGNEPFTLQPMNGRAWELALIVPVAALWNTALGNLSGKTLGANFYKCGDLLPRPHFLSWAPLRHPTPKFHLPMQFGIVNFK